MVGRASRIYNGVPASIKDYPYLVSLRVCGLHTCGGAIISDRHILTAAHCTHGSFNYPYDNVTIHAGSTETDKPGYVYRVAKVTEHPQYVKTSNHFANDIAVITVSNCDLLL